MRPPIEPRSSAAVGVTSEGGGVGSAPSHGQTDVIATARTRNVNDSDVGYLSYEARLYLVRCQLFVMVIRSNLLT